MSFFKKLRRELVKFLNARQINEVHKAYLLAERAHQGQTRHTGEPYITHPVEVATVVASMRLDVPTIMAALMHDVLEDTEVTRDEMIAEFGTEVTELVDGVSKLTQINFETRAQAQAENFRKMIMAMTKDIRVIIIKLSDRLHNMRTLSVLQPAKRRRIARETLEIYAPIANRLGMHAFRIEYEDLGFEALYPTRYRVLKRAVQKARGNRKGVISEIEKNLKRSLKKANYPPFKLLGREKHLYSIFKKMRNKHLSFAEIMDIYAFRVIVDSVDTAYRVLGTVHNLYKPLPHRFKDYIAIPKANGYQSLHTILFGPYGVPIEIQIRTHEMEKMAENGIAAHWLYKSSEKIYDASHLRIRSWMKGLLEMQRSAADSMEFIENVKIDLFPDEVYVFTPKGQIMELPGGATAVDFAYAVHSDIGNSCIAAKLDRRLSPLSTPLSSGQTIEIISAPGARPNPAWLNFVVTGKARSNIKHFLKTQRRSESVELGHRLVLRALQDVSSDFEIHKKDLAALVKASNLKSEKDLFEEVGLGNRVAHVVAEQIIQLRANREKKPLPTSAVKAVDEVTQDEDVLVASNSTGPLFIRGSEGLVIKFAACCRPIPGDPIVGVLEPGKGLLVHVEQCSQIDRQRLPDDVQRVSLRWEDDIEGGFAVDVRVDLLNQRGILANLAMAFTEAEANINNMRAEEYDSRYCVVDLTVSVKGRKHLASVMRKIRSIDGVIRITRYKN